MRPPPFFTMEGSFTPVASTRLRKRLEHLLDGLGLCTSSWRMIAHLEPMHLAVGLEVLVVLQAASHEGADLGERSGRW